MPFQKSPGGILHEFNLLLRNCAGVRQESCRLDEILQEKSLMLLKSLHNMTIPASFGPARIVMFVQDFQHFCRTCHSCNGIVVTLRALVRAPNLTILLC
jgi:hypothetical protein